MNVAIAMWTAVADAGAGRMVGRAAGPAFRGRTRAFHGEPEPRSRMVPVVD